MSEPPNIAPNTNTNIVNVTPYPPAAISYKNYHGGATGIRDYRKGNWTIEETLILITAKKLDDERRINASSSTAANNRGGELRWKWVENYCWSNGCLRSQNQCNDKWDNLLRDYKKVREYELRSPSQNKLSYWSMDKSQRKDRNLPSNMLHNIYEALNDVVHKKLPQNRHSSFDHHHQPLPPPPLPVLPPPPPPILPEVPLSPRASEASESSETQGDEAEKVDNETKRRRVRNDIGSSILHSTTLLSETLKHYDDKKEKRHRQLMEVEQQRLHLEETRNEINRQGVASLITSINKLSDAIHALISEKRT